MSKLLMFYVGGSAPYANIELHDIQFVVADTPEAAYPLLRERWFGDKKQIHVDGYLALSWADGYDILLQSEPSTEEQKLFFINVGGYHPEHLAELHEFGLFVAPTAEQAKQKAKEVLLKESFKQHKDDLVEVDDCLQLQQLQGYHVHLRANPHGQRDIPLWQGYLPIGE